MSTNMPNDTYIESDSATDSEEDIGSYRERDSERDRDEDEDEDRDSERDRDSGEHCSSSGGVWREVSSNSESESNSDSDNDSSESSHSPSLSPSLSPLSSSVSVSLNAPPRFPAQVKLASRRRMSKYFAFTQISVFVAVLALADLVSGGALQHSLQHSLQFLLDLIHIHIHTHGDNSHLLSIFSLYKLGLGLSNSLHNTNDEGRIVQPNREEIRLFAMANADATLLSTQVSSNIIVAVLLSAVIFAGGNYLRLQSNSGESCLTDSESDRGRSPFSSPIQNGHKKFR